MVKYFLCMFVILSFTSSTGVSLQDYLPAVEVPEYEEETEETALVVETRSYSKEEIRQMVRDAADRNNIPRNILLRMAWAESRFSVDARSPVGAAGVMQLMPATAEYLGVINIYDPEENIEAGARYYRYLYNRFGCWKLAAAAYNAGPGRVDRYGGIPPFAETIAYVKNVFPEKGAL